jgi:Na+/H+-dicarboxylate symporter
MKLWHKVTIGLIAGIICGRVFGEQTANIKPIGDIFINLIKMVISPLIYFSLIAGITSISDPTTLGRIGVKSTIAFLITTALAIMIGLGVAVIMQPGAGLDLPFAQSATHINHQEFNLLTLLINIVPTNAIGALSGEAMLPVVFFAIFTGITLNKMDDDKKRLVDIFNLLSKLMFKMITIIMEFSPYGAFALTAYVVGKEGMEVLTSLSKLIGCVVLAMFVQYIVFGILIKIFSGLSPWPFYKKSLEYQSIAFSTSSSKATLSTSMNVCREKMGISGSSVAFILPLGASMNMDGMAIYLGMCAVFFAQALEIHLTGYNYLMIIITSTLGSIGAAGIPGGSMIMLPMVLATINIPVESIGLIMGIDRILDMLRTTINITGDATITLIVDKSEGTLDVDKYYS